MRGRQIRQHHGVLAIGVLEKIIDSILLHEAREERKIGFAILNAVGNFVVFAGGTKLKSVRSEPRLGEHVLDDLLDILVEKNSAIGPVSEQPKPRAQHESIVENTRCLHPLRLGQNAVEEAYLTPL